MDFDDLSRSQLGLSDHGLMLSAREFSFLDVCTFVYKNRILKIPPFSFALDTRSDLDLVLKLTQTSGLLQTLLLLLMSKLVSLGHF